MKKVKILLALVLALLIATTALPLMASAADTTTGDVFEVTSIPDNWKWYSSSYVSRENNGAKFGVNADKGKGLDNYGILACNSSSTEVIKPNTTYIIELRVETWFKLTELQIDIGINTALWANDAKTPVYTSITDLDQRSSDIVGGNGSKLNATVTFEVTTPTTISGNQHFVIGVIPKSGATGGAANLRFYNIKITEVVENTTPACTHENQTTTNTATYFKDGVVTVVCDDCGETISETAAAASDAALKGEFIKTFADGKLTISGKYIDALLLDIATGAKISFNYSIAGYSNTVELQTNKALMAHQ